jgi:hypothetical protein
MATFHDAEWGESGWGAAAVTGNLTCIELYRLLVEHAGAEAQLALVNQGCCSVFAAFAALPEVLAAGELENVTGLHSPNRC